MHPEATGTLDYRGSPLLRLAMAEHRFDVWEYFDEGPYPGHGEAKAEVEQHVAAAIAEFDSVRLSEGLERHSRYLAIWVPERLRAANGGAALARLVAFADLQYQVEDSRGELMRRSLEPPKADDPVFDQLPSLHQRLTRDGLLPIGADSRPSHWTGAEAVIALGTEAVFAHPHLADKRELFGLLLELTGEERLEVAVAIDPYRQCALAEIEPRLLEDYWSGIKTTAENLDSLDAHDVGSASFHAVGERGLAAKFFNPMLGTWFDWTRRGDEASDPVKRLYVREVRPPRSRHGDQLLAVINNELHAERDTQRRLFTHVDGKVRRYPVSTYGPSQQNPRANPGPSSHSRKLWRVDGEMTDAEWGELVGLHFRGNELIEEHFAAAFPAMAASDS